MVAPHHVLRSEAQPAMFRDLDGRQQQGFDRVVESLALAVESIDRADAPTPGPGPFLQFNRLSRTVLISGQRGTGKTTLMLSLTDVLGATSKRRDRDSSMPPDLAARVERLRRRLVWLEPLDMEPLPSSANLLGGILARVERALDDHLEAPESTRGPLHPSYEFHAATDQLRNLQTSVALAFDDNLNPGTRNVDPDTFANEMKRAEHERVGFNERLIDALASASTALDTLTNEFVTPLFVLPVDDLDLNPAACVPMLELLRAAQAPHLFVVLVADQDLILHILELKYRGDLARLASPAVLTDADVRQSVPLAENAMRKHLPPQQRVHLTLLRPEEALEFRPLGRFSEPPLGSIFGDVETARDELSLTSNPGVRRRGAALHLGQDADLSELAGWPDFLFITVRELTDLYLAARQGEGGDELRRVVRQRYRQLVATRGGAQQPMTSIVRPLLVWGDASRPVTPFQVREARHRHWQVTEPGGRELEPERAATVLALLDLDGSDRRWVGEGEFVLDVPSLMRTEIVRRLPRTLGSNEEGFQHTFEWPMLTHSTLWGYERAKAVYGLARSEWSRREHGLPHGPWVAAMTALLGESFSQNVTAERLPKAATSWAQLGKELNSLPAEAPLVEEWLVAVGWLCTPEMGLPQGANHPLIPARLIPAVRERRQANIAELPEEMQGMLQDWVVRPYPRSSVDDDV